MKIRISNIQNLSHYLDRCLTQAGQGYFNNVTGRRGGGEIFLPLFLDLRNYWTKLQNSMGVRLIWKHYLGKPIAVDLGITDDATDQVKVKRLDDFKIR